MRGVASLVVAAVLGGVVWAGLSYRASEAREDAAFVAAEDLQPIGLVQAPVAVEPTDAQRRAALNERLHTMLREGRGARLTDAPVRRAASREPAARSGPVRRAGYAPPSLDLKTAPQIPDNDLDCLTQAIYYEARNESEAGQAAVAEVVMNRVRHPAYPDRVCAVVYQRNSRTCQFTFTCDGSIGRSAVRPAAWARAQRIARDVLEGRHAGQLPANSVNYHANYVSPSWGQRLARVRQIGAHIFYGAPLNGGTTPGASQASDTGPAFVRNDAIERAYERLMGPSKDAGET